MITRRSLAASFFAVALTTVALGDPSTQVNFNSGSFTFQTNLGVDLSPGGPADGNGTVIQLGYFSGATAGDNFLGTWIPLTGEGSANTGQIDGLTINFNQTSIGDSFTGTANTPGTFALGVVFDTAVSNKSQNLPGSTSIPLAIRFYNTTTVTGASLYNTVSSDLWMWQTPGPGPIPPTLNLSLDDLGLQWESIDLHGLAATQFRTVIPEPSAASLILLGIAGLGLRRRRSV